MRYQFRQQATCAARSKIETSYNRRAPLVRFPTRSGTFEGDRHGVVTRSKGVDRLSTAHIHTPVHSRETISLPFGALNRDCSEWCGQLK